MAQNKYGLGAGVACTSGRKVVFRSDQIEALHSSLAGGARKCLQRTTLLIKPCEGNAGSRGEKSSWIRIRSIKRFERLQEKQRDEHFFNENKKEQLELEDVIGSRVPISKNK